jgi:hypothetical protein
MRRAARGRLVLRRASQLKSCFSGHHRASTTFGFDDAGNVYGEIAAAKRESDARIKGLQADEHFLERLLQMEVR